MPSYYDLALAQMGLAAPASPFDYVRNPESGRRSYQPAPSPAILQAAVEHDIRTRTPSVIYNPFYDGNQPQIEPVQISQPQPADARAIADYAANASPEQQNALSRALFATTGLAQEPTFGEQRRQQALQIALGDYKDQLSEMRNRRQGQRDLQEARNLFEQGTIRDGAYESAVADIVKKNPSARSTPEYAAFAGIEQQLMQQRQAKLEGFAQLHNAPLHHVQWDEKADAPTFNNSAIAYDSAKLQLELNQAKAADLPIKNQIAAQKARVDVIKGQYDTVTDSIRATEDQGKTPAAHTLNLQTQLSQQLLEAQAELRSFYRGPQQQAAAPPERAAAAERLQQVREQAIQTAQKYPKLPKGSRFLGEFTDAVTARSKTPPNSYAALQGQLLYRDASGKFSVVQ